MHPTITLATAQPLPSTPGAVSTNNLSGGGHRG